jgi:hypothetical protein
MQKAKSDQKKSAMSRNTGGYKTEDSKLDYFSDT